MSVGAAAESLSPSHRASVSKKDMGSASEIDFDAVRRLVTGDEFNPGARQLLGESIAKTADMRLDRVGSHTLTRQGDLDPRRSTAAERQLRQCDEFQHIVQDGGPIRTEVLCMHWGLANHTFLICQKCSAATVPPRYPGALSSTCNAALSPRSLSNSCLAARNRPSAVWSLSCTSSKDCRAASAIPFMLIM